MKKQKQTSLNQSYTRDGKTLNVSFNPDGDCTITIKYADSEISFEIPEPLTDSLRLLFWDNYRRHHIWKTKAQKKEEKRQEALNLLDHVKEDISYDDIIFPDFGILPIDLPDITDLDEKKSNKSI